jgi:hypothetical protein
MTANNSIRNEELPPLGIVSRTAAGIEQDIQRYAGRQEALRNTVETELKKQGAIKSKARKTKLVHTITETIEQKGEEQPRDELNKAAWQEAEEEGDSFQEQLDLFREDQERRQQQELSSTSPTKINLPISFSKSSPSLVGGVAQVENEGGVAPEEHPQGQGEEKKKKPPPNGSKEISDSWQTQDTEDTSSVESDYIASTVENNNAPYLIQDTGDTSSVVSVSTASTVEINNASIGLRGDSPNNRTASLELQVQMLLKEAELRDESMQMMAMELEQTQRNNEKLIDKLKGHLVKLSKELEDYPRQLQYWKQKSLELSKKVCTLEVELDEKEESIEDLVEYKQSQDVKIDNLEREVETLRLERRRDRAEEVVDKLLIPPKREITRSASASLLMGITNSCDSIATEETVGLEESYRKDEEKTKVDVSALDVTVARIAQEKAEIQAELEEMRLMLAESSAKAQKQRGKKESKKQTKVKRVEESIYQFSCRECCEGTHAVVLVLATTKHLKRKASEIVEQSATFAATGSKQVGMSYTPFKLGGLSAAATAAATTEETEEVYHHSASVEDAFVQHLASHVPKKATRSVVDALAYCKKIIKVESLKKLKQYVSDTGIDV